MPEPNPASTEHVSQMPPNSPTVPSPGDWPMPPHQLNRDNIADAVREYVSHVEDISLDPIAGLKGLELLHALKRDEWRGYYLKNLTRFEAFNRIMTDLVILYGVRWLLLSKPEEFPFRVYDVKYGNEGGKGFDIEARANGHRLIGEAFNVAPSYFQGKRRKDLQKLLDARVASVKVMMFNDDAARQDYRPQRTNGVRFVRVNVCDGVCSFCPE